MLIHLEENWVRLNLHFFYINYVRMAYIRNGKLFELILQREKTRFIEYN